MGYNWNRRANRKRHKQPASRDFPAQRYVGRNLVADDDPTQHQSGANLHTHAERRQSEPNPLNEQIKSAAPEAEIIPPQRKFGGAQENAGRPPFEPTEEQRKIVRAAFGWGVPQAGVAAHLGVAERTLKKHFAQEMEEGRFQAHMTVGQNIYKQATKDHLGAFPWAKLFATTQMGWKETVAHEVTGRDGGPIEAEFNVGGLSDDLLTRLIELREQLALAGGAEGGTGEAEGGAGT